MKFVLDGQEEKPEPIIRFRMRIHASGGFLVEGNSGENWHTIVWIDCKKGTLNRGWDANSIDGLETDNYGRILIED